MTVHTPGIRAPATLPSLHFHFPAWVGLTAVILAIIVVAVLAFSVLVPPAVTTPEQARAAYLSYREGEHQKIWTQQDTLDAYLQYRAGEREP